MRMGTITAYKFKVGVLVRCATTGKTGVIVHRYPSDGNDPRHDRLTPYYAVSYKGDPLYTLDGQTTANGFIADEDDLRLVESERRIWAKGICMTTFTATKEIPEIHIHFPAARHDNFERNQYFSILGDVVQPLVLANPDCYFWVTWYDDEELSTYGDRYALPPDEYTWKDDDDIKTSFICLRIAGNGDDKMLAVMKEVTERATEKGYYASFWQIWDVVGDLGSNRFIRPDATPEERERRAHLITQFMDITTRLLMDALICIHGTWMIEPNNSTLSRNGNFLTAVHHLFCNATDVPLIARSPDRVKGIEVQF